jgi:hypothetical protein
VAPTMVPAKRRYRCREIMNSFDTWSQSAPIAVVSMIFGAAAAVIVVAALYGVDLVVGQVINGSWVHRP